MQMQFIRPGYRPECKAGVAGLRPEACKAGGVGFNSFSVCNTPGPHPCTTSLIVSLYHITQQVNRVSKRIHGAHAVGTHSFSNLTAACTHTHVHSAVTSPTCVKTLRCHRYLSPMLTLDTLPPLTVHSAKRIIQPLVYRNDNTGENIHRYL